MSISIEKINMDLILNNVSASTVLATDSSKKIVSVSNSNASSSTFLAGDLTWKSAGGGASTTVIAYYPGTNYNTSTLYNAWIVSFSGISMDFSIFNQTKSYFRIIKNANWNGSGQNLYRLEYNMEYTTVTGGATNTLFYFIINVNSFIGSETILEPANQKLIAHGNMTDIKNHFVYYYATGDIYVKYQSNTSLSGAWWMTGSFEFRTQT